ncbi:hypothetical protein J1N35_000112 [Gossypium stocksii]|uniref:Aminotransferase-like plant mobile domain-containing protein n=1 Tax=Gossypium stocksii TaxID=47602 RepID=A0A9D4AKJ8_9ROSI|nr:hypothetical protein J1N35_000112 [Gossypium stocksii]
MARLVKDDPYISNVANNMDSYRVMRGQVNGIGYPPDERLMPYLEQVGFGSVALIRTFDLRYDLISALVERRRPETHTFHFPSNATKGELMCTARAYIMNIIGGVLMSDAKNNKVHIIYLPLLADLNNVHSYNWGSTVLAMLYQELCWTTKPVAVDMGGCLTLLQLWALYRMPFLVSIEYFSWYREVVHYPDISSDDRTTCRGRVPWESNAATVWLHPIYPGSAMRGGVDSLNTSNGLAFDLQPLVAYTQWYSTFGKPYILGGQSTVVPPHMQRAGAYESEADMEAELDPEPEPEP